MLHFGDNKIAVNRFPDFPDRDSRAVKKNHDIPSSDGFFNLLKDMARPLDEGAAMLHDRTEPLRDVYSPVMYDNDRSIRQPEARGEVNNDATAAAGKPAEHTDRDARISEQDDKTREARQASEKKQAAENQPKRPADPDSNHRTRLDRKLKGNKSEESDTRELFEGLHRMIDVIRTGETGEARHSRAPQGELHDVLKNRHFDRGLLKKQIEGLIATAERMSRAMQPENAAQLTRALAGLKQLLSKMKGAHDKNQTAGSVPQGDAGLQAVKDLLTRVELIVESAKGDGARQSGGDGHKGGDLFSFSHARSDMPARGAEATAARQQQSALFSEHLDSILQNAKVVVKDGRNASFSVRLNPRELGSVNISLDLTEGIVNGKFMVTSQEAKEMLISNLDQIRQQLHDAGISVGEFQVNVNDQRGKLLDGDPERLPVIPPAEQAAEIESRFAPNARALDDGHFDVII